MKTNNRAFRSWAPPPINPGLEISGPHLISDRSLRLWTPRKRARDSLGGEGSMATVVGAGIGLGLGLKKSAAAAVAATTARSTGGGGGGCRCSLTPFLYGKKIELNSRAKKRKAGGGLVVYAGGMGWEEAARDLFLGVGVGLPCTVMECGDVIYRSTLPRSSGLNVTAPGVFLALSAFSYLWATPGVAPGFWDMFILAFLERLFRRTYRKDDFVLGKKLGEGAFGVVYKASLANKSSPKKQGDLVLKKATEYGAVEIWMNERVRRACSSSCADFVYGFLESSSKGKGSGEYWLIWKFEGEATLSDLMLSKEFPYNVGSRTFKIIDLGAAADLRVGINYIPKEFLLDPRYTAPEQYIMSTQTPSAPSAPVATALSPVLWQAFPSLRTDSSLIQFNRQLKRCGYDLVEWRKTVEPRASPELRKGFELLDLDGGIGWELLTSMVRYKARQRTSAKAALAHPYFKREGLLGLSFMQSLRLQLFRATQKDYSEAAKWIVGLMARSGTEKEGGFTEAQLQELRESEPKKKANLPRNALASVLRLRRKIERTINESMDELNSQRKSLWWSSPLVMRGCCAYESYLADNLPRSSGFVLNLTTP
ncbi:Serine/threonine-protein kinase stn7, chloroplastic [Asimina triloba]